MKKILSIHINDIFGDMQCVGTIDPNKGQSTYYVMECLKCHRRKNMLSSTIRNQKGIYHSSCGRGLKTQDMVFYQRWTAMRTRTTNPKYEHYDCYGGRGIKSDDFKYFVDFYDTMYPSFIEASEKWGKENTSLERIDYNGDYTPSNCIWIHKNEQQGNTRKNIVFLVYFPDGTSEVHVNLKGFCSKHELNISCAMDVLNGKRKSYKGYMFYRINKSSNSMEYNDYSERK